MDQLLVPGIALDQAAPAQPEASNSLSKEELTQLRLAKESRMITNYESRFAKLGLGNVFVQLKLQSGGSKRSFETQAFHVRHVLRLAENILQALLDDLSGWSQSFASKMLCDSDCLQCDSDVSVKLTTSVESPDATD